MTGDINPLVGRHFVSKAGNIGHVSRLGDGAARVTWRQDPSTADVAEFSAWVESVLALPVDLTVCTNAEKEAAMLAEWKRGSR